MVIRSVSKRYGSQRGALTVELVVAMTVLAIATIPLSYSFMHERQLIRACYYRSVAMEIVDGEMEMLQAGEWREFSEGSQPYTVTLGSVNSLPPGQFVLTRAENRLRLEWLPHKRGQGGLVSREVQIE